MRTRFSIKHERTHRTNSNLYLYIFQSAVLLHGLGYSQNRNIQFKNQRETGPETQLKPKMQEI